MWQANFAPDLHFVHLSTSVLNEGDLHRPSTGQTVWGNPLQSSVAAVAWDWVQLAQGVFAMADPLGLVTNLHLVGDRGQALSEAQMILHLNELIRTLPWQDEVQRALRQYTTPH